LEVKERLDMNIIIYSTTTCATCHLVTSWLDKQGFQYNKKNTDTDPQAMLDFMSVNDGAIGVPFTVITDESGTETKIMGFDQTALKNALGLK